MRFTKLAAVAAVLCGSPLAAHDFWLQPDQFATGPGIRLPMIFLVGHGVARQRSTIGKDRVKLFRAIGPQGSSDRLGDLTMGQAADAGSVFTAPGTYVLAFSTSNVPSELPALRFNDYATAEGLSLVLQQRTASRATNSPGRELYSRRGKALIQVGSPGKVPQPQVTAPVGLGLEIVPLINPYQPGTSKTLPVRVLYQGRPLVGALVKLNNLQADAEPVEMHRSDSTGQTSFSLPRTGQWQLNVVWSQPLPRNGTADFLTTFSSLSFGFGQGTPR